MRRILHVDMDAFFAAVEQLRHPELRGKPVIVGGRGDPTERGVVSTASYEARRFGIHSGMPLRTTLLHCPDAVFLPVDYEAYAAISRRIKTVLRGFALVVEDVGLDETFLDISGLPGSSEEIARAVKRRVQHVTGLTCSVGVAPNKLLAKIASKMEKPDGLTILKKGDVPRRVWPLSARKIWGIGPKTEARLAAVGILTVGDLAALPMSHLTERFGETHGRYLYRAARGIDESPVVAVREPHSISRQTTFQRDIADKRMLVRVLRGLTREVVAEARAEGYRARTVTTKLRFADFETLTRQKTLGRHTNALRTIEKTVLECLERIELVKKVRLVGVRLSRLEPIDQPSRGPLKR